MASFTRCPDLGREALVKIIAWNLNHRAGMKTIPESVAGVIRKLSPDILVLTEYVDSDSHTAFKQSLVDMGLSHISLSTKRDGHNQVLLASRSRHTVGGIPSPMESHAYTNFLPSTFPELDTIIVGIRAPAYKASAEVRSYWVELTKILETASLKKLVLVGDLNGDPDSPASIGGGYLKALRARGWKIPSPTGDWSYISSDGLHRSRIDHVLASPAVGAVVASYITEVNGITVAGTKDLKPISDHAIILCKVGLESSHPNEVIVKVVAEGGDIALYGVRTPDGWVFSRDVIDQTPELLDEPWNEHSSSRVKSWPAALALLDKYPWHKLYPQEVHKEFGNAVLEAVEERYRAQGITAGSRLPEWKALCESSERNDEPQQIRD